MKITLLTTEIIDDIYADSALHVALTRRSGDQLPAILTDDHRDALMRVVVNAAAMTAGELAGQLQGFAVSGDESEIAFEFCDRTAAVPEALRIHLDTAVKFAAMYLVAVQAGNSFAADSYRRCLSHAVDAATAALDRPRPSLSLPYSYC